MSSTSDDLRAMLRQLQAQLPAAPPEMRRLLEQQIQALESAAQLAGAAPPIADRARHRPQIPADLRAFLTPEPPAAVPAWVPDSTPRSAATAELLRCPAGAKVFSLDDSVGCGISRSGGIPIAHGLTLSFWSSGALSAQRYYEHALLRWAVEYHPSGGRASQGFWVDREPKVHLEHGLQTAYHPNGVVSSQSTWTDGVRHGWTKLWQEDGFPIGATLYEYGEQAQQILPDGTRR